MEVLILEPEDDFSILTSLIKEWMLIGGGFNIPVDVKTVLFTLHTLTLQHTSVVFALVENDNIHGILGLKTSCNHVGSGLIAEECLYFVSRLFRQYAKRLKNNAELWAKAKGCSHLVLTASKLANPAKFDRVERLFQLDGYTPYETTFIKELK